MRSLNATNYGGVEGANVGSASENDKLSTSICPSIPMNESLTDRRRIRRFPKHIRLSTLHVLIFLYVCSLMGGNVGCRLPCVTNEPEKYSLAPFPLVVPVCALRTQTKRIAQRETDDQSGSDDESSNAAVAAKEKPSLNQILVRAGIRGLGGGIPGALAGVVQVLALMWLRTTANYQSRYGTTFAYALKTLLREGGIQRLYRGLSFALIQAPLMRFVSTAANDGVEALLASFETTRNWGPGRTTVFASIVVGFARILLMPIDTMKTVLQVDSSEGFRNLIRRIRAGKFMVLYQGSTATAISAVAGHYPWFFTFNFLSNKKWVARLLPSKLLRNAAIGFIASIVSDTATNFLKVIKTTKQALGSKHNSTYGEVIRMILAADGWKGLLGRGLRTRIGTNALQSILFTIIWRGLAERFQRRRSAKREREIPVE